MSREEVKTIGAFVFIGTIAYLVTLLFNDSVVSVATLLVSYVYGDS